MIKEKLKTIPSGTVIRLDDGRIGWKGVEQPWIQMQPVIFPDDSGITLFWDIEVEVLRYPAQMAREYIKTVYPAAGQGQSKELCFECMEHPSRANSYFCSDRCAVLYAEDDVRALGPTWNEAEQKWDTANWEPEEG
jgi:hypothetical protein